MSWHPFNLTAVRGNNSPIVTFQYWHCIYNARCILPGSISDHLIITPIPIPIAAGTKLLFSADGNDACGAIEITTSAEALPGSVRLEIETYSGALAEDWQAAVAPINLTGRTYSAKVRQQYADPAPYFDLNIVMDEPNGVVSLSAATQNETPNAFFYELPADLEQLQMLEQVVPKAKLRELQEKSYYWDLEYVENGIVTTDKMGRFWLIAEATRP